LDNDVTADTSVPMYENPRMILRAERRASRIPREQDPGQSVSHSCVGMRADADACCLPARMA
jgi:hypothetical protein